MDAETAEPEQAQDAPEVDAYGFAPTRMVRVKVNRLGFPMHFERAWMKPSDLAFPEQWRRLVGAEHDKAVSDWMAAKMRGEEMAGALAFGAGQAPTPAGGYAPNARAAAQEEVVPSKTPQLSE